jgi:flagellar motility protein MotE (MotC chaperone)
VPTSNSAVKVPEADIKMGNVSLKDFIAKTNSSLSAIEDRLNILQINQQLEKDWKDLRELGQQYRQLEKEILDKIKVWDKLK